MMRGFLVAVAFLTILPARFRQMPSLETVARSRFWFPVVGLLLGGLLGGWTARVGTFASPPLGAFLVLAVWVGVTGALHIDGVADCCDGLFGGSTPENRLRIMKDPRVGTFGAVGMTMLLLGKYSALHELLGLPAAGWTVAAAVAAARCLALCLAAGARYPRPEGTGKLLVEAIRPTEGILYFFAAVASVGVMAPTWETRIGALGATVLALLGLRGLAQRRLGGVTGDCLGAGIELAELVFLLAAACLPPTTG